jgi:hypothetical protein
MDNVIQQLRDHPALQHAYLHALFKKDVTAGQKYHELQVLLYAEHDPDNLMTFLRNSNAYLLEEALRICDQKKLYREMVYLLRRMGNSQKALELMIDELKDVNEAISFVEENKDESMWEELISRSMASPKFLADLMQHAGAHHVDLLKLIENIPDKLIIPGLRDKLKKIFADCHLQIEVRRGCNSILRGDCVSLHEKVHRRRQRAARIQIGTRCAICDGEMFASQLTNVMAFWCKHTYHSACLDAQRADRGSKPHCIKCQSQQFKRNTKKQDFEATDLSIKTQ